MLRAARARRIAAATAFGGGGLTLVGGGTVALLYLQGRLARRAVGRTQWESPGVNGLYGDGGGPPIHMLVIGDSTAAGYAVDEAAQTPGVLLATGLAAASDRPVRLYCTGTPGATSAHLATQLEWAQTQENAPATRYDVTVIFIGANDVIRRVRPNEAVSRLREVTRELVGQGTQVVLATCPDLGSIRPIGWPLRSVARLASRQLAAAQTIAVTEEGGRTVSLSDLLSSDFQEDPVTMFGPDRFHPSARGYSQAAFAVLPSTCAALGLLPELDEAGERTTGVLPVDRAAVVAAQTAGTEVSRPGVPGSPAAEAPSGARGRWSALIRGPFQTRGRAEHGEPAEERPDVNRPGEAAHKAAEGPSPDGGRETQSG